MLKKWNKLPESMRRESVYPYYLLLIKKRFSFVLKRIFDIIAAILLIIVLAIPFLFIALAIKLDSKGPVIFKQTRVTRCNKNFRMLKFRTMVTDAERLSGQLTTSDDPRITRIGRRLRKLRLDELPQLLNIVSGSMSFVGPRPEVPRYVEAYSDEMIATLLLPAGVTSPASIAYKDEDLLLRSADDADGLYINRILPEKMAFNLDYIRNFTVKNDVKIMLATLTAVFLKHKKGVPYRAEEDPARGKAPADADIRINR